ncbi:MAG: TonB-dependent receptor [Chloracidobacterium sp.]|nr:TonB-dependent receptor [Chloracidobacterium sp.]
MRRRSLLGIVLAFALFMLVGGWHRAFAQATFAKVVGDVRDTTGASVVGAKVTITNDQTGDTFTQITAELGSYNFQTLNPGAYRIRCEASGFRPIDIKGIVLQVNQIARYDVKLEIGQTSDNVTITTSAPVLATETSDVGQVINRRQIAELPLNGRNFIQLAGLTNGVLIGGGTESGGPQFTSQGGRPTQNSVLIDGIESRIQREGGYGINLSVEALQEFKVMQNTFAADYGRATAIVNTSIRSGTNDFHGAAFEFLRNDVFDARNAFDFRPNKPPLRRNQFGGNFGGPIFHNKLFFFTNYEGTIERRAFTSYAFVPTAEQLAGDLSGFATTIRDPETGLPFAGNRIPESRISQFARASRMYYPTPTPTAQAGANFQANRSSNIDAHQGLARIDYTLSERDRFSGHYIEYRYQSGYIGALAFTGNQTVNNARNISAEHVHTFSSNLINTFRYGYSWTNNVLGQPEFAASNVVADEFGIKNLFPDSGLFSAPQINISGFSSLGGGAFQPNGSVDRNNQFIEQLTYIRGHHSMKFGGDLRLYRWDDLGYATRNGSFNFNGQFTGNAFADFLLGYPNQVYATQAGGQGFTFFTKNNEYSLYAQDDIRVRGGLSLNLGLRYEYVQWPKEKNNEFAVWNFEKGGLDLAGRDIDERVAPADKNNLGPRIGLAWSPQNSKSTVIRAGASIMYGNFRQWEVSLFHFSPPYVYDRFLFNGAPVSNPSFPITPEYTTANLFPAVDTNLDRLDFTSVTVNYQSPDKVLPIQYQWNLGVQRELFRDTVIEVGYVGNRADHQPNRWDANPARPNGPGESLSIQARRPYQNVGFVSGNTSRAWSNYNALNLRIEKRFSDGLYLLGNYTYSKSMAIRAWDNWTVMDINNIRLNYGPANDFRHIARLNFVYDLPFGKGRHWLSKLPAPIEYVLGGWQANGIFQFYSGAALGVGSDISNDRGSRAGNRADRLCDGNLSGDKRTKAQWFDTSCFRDPVPGAFGSAGEGVIRGPGGVNPDLGLFKNFRVRERINLQFRWEMFNAFNVVNLGNPNTDVSDTSNFGRISGAGSAREMQFGLKIIF